MVNLFNYYTITITCNVSAMSARVWKRALVVLLAFDKNGNYACGGSKDKSVSGQVGRAMLQNATWAICFAKLIDLLMGEDHCKATAIKEGTFNNNGEV